MKPITELCAELRADEEFAVRWWRDNVLALLREVRRLREDLDFHRTEASYARAEAAQYKAERDEARAVMLSCLEVASEDGCASGMMRMRYRLEAALARKEGA